MTPEIQEMLRQMGKAAIRAFFAQARDVTAEHQHQRVGLAALREITTGNCRTCWLDSHRCPWAEDVPNTHTLISPNQRKAGADCPAAKAREAGDGK